jgi:hypothetical protein
MQYSREKETDVMQQISILQMANGEPDANATAATYAEGVRQWGLPTVHTQLLQELRAWIETVPALRRQPRMALERILEIEGSILMDASVAGLAAEHIPFLYTVLGEVFDELGPEFRRALHREAALAEKAHENDIHQQMGEAGTEDRLDAVYEMENVALERLQERQERVMLLLEGLGEEDISVLSSNAP